jgi:hypothetical protein
MFQSEEQLPWRHPKRKGGKKTIAHFEEVMKPDSTDEKEIEEKGKKVKESWGINKLNNEIKAMKRIDKPTPADIRYITRLEKKIASIEGNIPVDSADVKSTVIPDL